MSERRGPARPPRVAGLRRRVGAEADEQPTGVEDPSTSGPGMPETEQEAAQESDVPALPAAGDDTDRDLDLGPTATAAARSRLPLVAFALVVVLLIAAVVALTLVGQRQSATATARAEALAAARAAAPKVLSYDYRRLDADFAAATAVTTGKFRTDYERTSSTVVRPLAVEVQGVVQATVVGAGVVEASPTRVELVMFVNQSTVSNKIEGTKLDQNRVAVTMSKVDGDWLVSDIEAL